MIDFFKYLYFCLKYFADGDGRLRGSIPWQGGDWGDGDWLRERFLFCISLIFNDVGIYDPVDYLNNIFLVFK